MQAHDYRSSNQQLQMEVAKMQQVMARATSAQQQTQSEMVTSLKQQHESDLYRKDQVRCRGCLWVSRHTLSRTIMILTYICLPPPCTVGLSPFLAASQLHLMLVI